MNDPFSAESARPIIETLPSGQRIVLGPPKFSGLRLGGIRAAEYLDAADVRILSPRGPMDHVVP